MEEEIAESPVLQVFAIRFWIHLEKEEFPSSPALFGNEHRPRRRTQRAFCRICIFANTSEFSKISADDQNPSAHTYPIFFLMQCRFAVFAINPLQKSNAFLPPCGRNTRPIVLSVFFFEKLLPATADRTPSAVVMRQVCWALLFCTIFGRGNLHENYES